MLDEMQKQFVAMRAQLDGEWLRLQRRIFETDASIRAMLMLQGLIGDVGFGILPWSALEKLDDDTRMLIMNLAAISLAELAARDIDREELERANPA